MKTPTPLRNAVFAALYIVLIVSAINWFGSMFENQDDTIMAPMVMISLFVLSAAIMGYLFVYEPLRLYLDGRKDEALPFFGKTVIIFAGCALVFVALLFATAGGSTPNMPGDGDDVFCTADAKLCPDGSSVGRVGPNCEFAPCPSSASENPRGVACTMDAKICPDGTAVGRIGPNCEFAPCPTPEFF